MAGVSETAQRPSHTTVAAGFVIGGSVGVVLSVAQQLSGLYSLETRESVDAFLNQPPGSGLGLDVSGALGILRVVLMAVAGCAAAAAVLGFHALRRSHRARVGLTILAAPLFLGGLATGGFLTSLVAASSLLLWLGPSGQWFRGEPVTGRRPTAAAPPPSPEPPATRPGTQAWHPPTPPEAGTPPPDPTRPPPWQPPGGPQPRRRPDALVWACVLTWAFSSAAVAVVLGSAVLMGTNPELVLDELQRQGRDVSTDDLDLLRTTTYVTAVVGALWALGAGVLAVLTYRGVRWARMALVVSTALAGVLCLLAAVTTLLALVPGVACVTTVVLLNRPEVRRWFGRA